MIRVYKQDALDVGQKSNIYVPLKVGYYEVYMNGSSFSGRGTDAVGGLFLWIYQESIDGGLYHIPDTAVDTTTIDMTVLGRRLCLSVPIQMGDGTEFQGCVTGRYYLGSVAVREEGMKTMVISITPTAQGVSLSEAIDPLDGVTVSCNWIFEFVPCPRHVIDV